MRRLTILMSFGILVACDGGKTTIIDSSMECGDPIAEAGDDVTMPLGAPVFLNGSQSRWCDDYDDNVVFTWSFITVPSASSVNESSLSANRTNAAMTPQFIPDVVGEYVLGLQVSDGVAVSSMDYVVVSVVAGDNAPTADCGGSYEGEVGQLVILDGSGSNDPENATLEYAWSLSSPTCSSLTSDNIFNEGSNKPSFVPDCSGLFVMTLTVSDGSHWSDPVICSVDVATENRIPVADAGKTGNLGGCTANPLQLSGYNSYDPDGDSLSFSWALVSAPTDSLATDANFNDTTAPAPTFAWDAFGTYTFQLQVHDGTSWSAPDLVDITIGDVLNNRRPIANAGDSVTVEASANCQSTSYSNECANCAPFTVMLDGSGSMDLDGDTLTYSWSENSGLLQIVNPNAALTPAIIPSQTVGTALSFDVVLTVEDCNRVDTDQSVITYTCVSN